ncbi:Uma2 family endonuclease [Phaeodactylibacter xiamenensis]|uniref:Uma2 family endonuclease n=1 Tax=Phaeodactylibacter xiamenensis TaxID=1524460 RepID=UPI003CCC034B
MAQLPRTQKERLAYDATMVWEADWDTFLDLLEADPYPMQYDKGQIYSFLDYATLKHEELIPLIISALFPLLERKNYRIFGSNLPLSIPGPGKIYFNADCTVVKGPSEHIPLRGEMKAITNPVILVEVLSESTYDFDLGQKFQRYKTIPSLQQVLYIDSQSPSVISYRRKDQEGTWLIEEFTGLEGAVPVLEEGTFSLKALYEPLEL